MIKTIISILTIISFCFGAFFYFDNRFDNYAKAGDLKAVEQRLDYKITSDQAQSKQQRIWQLEDRYRSQRMPDTVMEEYRQLKQEKGRLDNQLKVLEKK